MNAIRSGVASVFALIAIASAFGQPATGPPPAELTVDMPRTTPTRVLAGLRGYPDEVVDALVRLASNPELLERAAEDIWAGREAVLTPEATPVELKTALEHLARSPGAVVVAAMHPEEMRLLQSLWFVAPEGAAARLGQLRAAYEQAAREAAAAWQRALEDDPVALGEYRDLLTRLCAAERQAAPGFACARVVDRRYYYACPPDEAVMAYANELGVPASVADVLAIWWTEHAPQQIDARLTDPRAPLPGGKGARDSVYTWPASERAPMWQPAPADSTDTGLGLVPVVLQPPADQPSEARLAVAVGEHARLWEPAAPTIAVPGPVITTAPQPDGNEPSIVIEEPIPGPQTARRDEIVDYDEIPYEIRRDYAERYYVGRQYGFSVIDPYDHDPFYYGHLGYSVHRPYRVYYSCDPYRAGGLRLNVGRRSYRSHGVRVCVPRGDERIHYGGGRHYGRASVSVSTRDGHDRRQVYIGTRDSRQPTRAYRPSGSRAGSHHRVTIHRNPTSRGDRSASATRGSARPAVQRMVRTGARKVVRAGPARAIRSGVRAIKQKVRNIRSRSGATRSDLRATRGASRSTGQRAIRSSSGRSHRSTADNRGHSGVRRRR